MLRHRLQTVAPCCGPTVYPARRRNLSSEVPPYVSPLLAVLLFLHVISAIVAFGPSFAFPIIGGLGARNPQHGAFAVDVSEAIEKRMVLPMALTMPITGVAMIIVAGIDPTTPWLAIAIVLYVIAVSYAFLVQVPAVAQFSRALHELAAGGPPPAGAPAGPPPHIAALSKKVARGGMLLSFLVVVIVFLMVTKLTFT
jgi:uncharacterized membrane protein